MRSEEARAEDYDYLLGMAMWSLTHERKEELLRKKQEKKQELEILMATSKEDMWRTDLKEFVKKLDEFEQKQRDNRESAGKKVMKKKDGSRKKAALGPSPAKGIRILPQISNELRKKASAANDKKEKKNQKDVFGKSLKDKMAEFDEPDEFDDMADDKEHNRSLSDRLGFNLKAEEKSTKSKIKKESSEKSKDIKNKKKRGKSPWEDASASNSDVNMSGSSDSGSDFEVFKEKQKLTVLARPERERKTVNYQLGDDSDSNQGIKSSSEEESVSKVGAIKNGHVGKNAILSDSEQDSDNQDKRINGKMATKQKKINAMFSNQTDSKKDHNEPGCDNAFDDLIQNGNSNFSSAAQENKNGGSVAMKNGGNPYESDSDESPYHKNGKNAVVPKLSSSPKSSQFQFSDSDSTDEVIGRSSSDDEFIPTKETFPKRKPQADKKKVNAKPIKSKVRTI